MVSVKRQHKAGLLARYRTLSTWNKLAVWGALASIIGLIPVAITSIRSLRPNVASAVETPIGEVIVGPTTPTSTRAEEVTGRPTWESLLSRDGQILPHRTKT
jgi:hypothetical protein